MLLHTIVLALALSAPPTAESLLAGFHEVDGTPVTHVAPEPLPEGATLTAHVTSAGVITIRQTLAGKKLDLLVIAPRPDQAGLLAHEMRVDVTRRDASGKATSLLCSGFRTSTTRFQPMLALRCFAGTTFVADQRALTTLTLTLERTALDIAEGPLHYRAPRVAAMRALAKASWLRLVRRVGEKATLPLQAQIAPRRSDAWALVPDTTAQVTVDTDAVRVSVDYAGATRARYALEGLPDWVSFTQPELLALRLVAPDGARQPRVCPLRLSQADKKSPLDTSGPAFALVGPCYTGLTEELFRRAQVVLVGLEDALPGVKEDGWIHLTVDDQRLLIVTSPAPKTHPDAWVRVDSAR